MTEETKTDEPKDVRLPFMVTASEAKAIDEWRYKNHIPSRAEAMRLLINRGIVFNHLADDTELIANNFINIDDDEKADEIIQNIADAILRQMALINSVYKLENKNMADKSIFLSSLLKQVAALKNKD